LKTLKDLEGANEDQTVGIRLLARSIEDPLRQIVESAGEDAAVVLNAVKAGKGAYLNHSFDQEASAEMPGLLCFRPACGRSVSEGQVRDA
jgi:chaperonin GroEL (HSP60 family)